MNLETGRVRPVPAVAAVIIQNGKLLLIKRAVEPSKGKWSVPGGSVEWGESLVEALKREVREETGLEIEVEKLAGVFDLIVEAEPAIEHSRRRTDDGPRITGHYVIVDYFAHPKGGVFKAGSDAEEARWVPIEELDQYELSNSLRTRLKEMGVT